MRRRTRPTKSFQQIKEEQINFLLEDVGKNLEEYKKALELKDRQLSDVKKILQNAKVSYDNIVKRNQELEKYIENIKIRYQQHRQQQQQKYFDREREYFNKEREKLYKKQIHEEELESEPELDENGDLLEEIEENVKKQNWKKTTTKKEKNNIIEYINSDAKRNR